MKIIAFDRRKPGVTLEDITPLLKEEVKYAWELYKAEIVRENYMRSDRPGAVLVLECVDLSEAQKITSDFPLVKAGLIEFDFIPLVPFTPIESLFEK